MVGRAQCYSSWGNVELSLLARLDVLASSRPHLKASAWARWPVLGSAVVVRGGGEAEGALLKWRRGWGGRASVQDVGVLKITICRAFRNDTPLQLLL